MQKYRAYIDRLRGTRREDSAGDIVSLVIFIIIPVMVLIAFVVMSSYFQARNNIQQQAASGARQVALYGGWDKNIPLNAAKQNVQNQVLNRIWSGGRCTFSNCSKKPVVTCSPQRATSLSDTASCSITYWYLPYENDGLGLANAAAQPFTVTSTYAVETYYRAD